MRTHDLMFQSRDRDRRQLATSPDKIVRRTLMRQACAGAQFRTIETLAESRKKNA